MRIIPVVLASLLSVIALSGEDISRNPSVSLAKETLHLAYVEGGGEITLNEYIRKDETLENWKVLLGVRYVRSAQSVDEVVERWKAYVAQVRSPGKKIKEADDSKPNDRRFSLAIRPPGDAYLETNELRFIPGPNGKGVIYYQAAIRSNPQDSKELMAGFRKQVDFAAALGALDLQLVSKMPEQAKPAASKK